MSVPFSLNPIYYTDKIDPSFDAYRLNPMCRRPPLGSRLILRPLMTPLRRSYCWKNRRRYLGRLSCFLRLAVSIADISQNVVVL